MSSQHVRLHLTVISRLEVGRSLVRQETGLLDSFKIGRVSTPSRDKPMTWAWTAALPGVSVASNHNHISWTKPLGKQLDGVVEGKPHANLGWRISAPRVGRRGDDYTGVTQTLSMLLSFLLRRGVESFTWSMPDVGSVFFFFFTNSSSE